MAEALTFKIGADTKAFQNGIKGAALKLAGLAAAFVSTQAIISSFSAALDMGGRLNDLASRTGATAGELSVLERAFQNAGVGAEKVGPSLDRMSKFIAEVEAGTGTAIEALDQLGIAQADLAGKTQGERFEIIARAISQIADPAQRSATAMKIFGRAGGELVPLFRNFSGEIGTAKDQLGSLPEILNGANGGFDAAGDAIGAIQQKLTEFSAGLLSTKTEAGGLLETLSKFDAAGLGQGIGNAFSGVMNEPLAAIELFGKTLLIGVMEAANALIDGVVYFGKLFLNTIKEVSALGIQPMIDGMVAGMKLAGKTLGVFLLQSAADFIAKLNELPGVKGKLDSVLSGLIEASDNLLISGEKDAQVRKDAIDQVLNGFASAVDKTEFIKNNMLDTSGLAEDAAKAFEKMENSTAAARAEMQAAADAAKDAAKSKSNEGQKPYARPTGEMFGPPAPASAAEPQFQATPNGGGSRSIPELRPQASSRGPLGRLQREADRFRQRAQHNLNFGQIAAADRLMEQAADREKQIQDKIDAAREKMGREKSAQPEVIPGKGGSRPGEKPSPIEDPIKQILNYIKSIHDNKLPVNALTA